MSAAPNMATITASLERSLQNCTINNHHLQSRGSNGGRRVDDLGRTRNTTSSYTNNDSNSVQNHRDYNNIYSSSNNSSVDYYSHHHDAALDLNSHISLPYQWEQCLDLKSGEIYYINWRTGMKAKEDPRMSHKEMIVDHHYDNYCTEEEEEEEEEEDDHDDDDDEEEEEEDDSSSSSSSSSSEVYSPPEVGAASASSSSSLLSRNEGDEERNSKDERSRQVLVVAGCKVCLMYFMVPKQVQLCPKCTSAQLLHF